MTKKSKSLRDCQRRVWNGGENWPYPLARPI
jgi:hypothetical protein